MLWHASGKVVKHAYSPKRGRITIVARVQPSHAYNEAKWGILKRIPNYRYRLSEIMRHIITNRSNIDTYKPLQK